MERREVNGLPFAVSHCVKFYLKTFQKTFHIYIYIDCLDIGKLQLGDSDTNKHKETLALFILCLCLCLKKE